MDIARISIFLLNFARGGATKQVCMIAPPMGTNKRRERERETRKRTAAAVVSEMLTGPL